MDASPKHSLILADDHPLFLKGLQIVLQKQFKILGSAMHGGHVLELTEAGTPDAIIMDLQMPIISGFDAARNVAIKYPQIKLIILSATYDDEIADYLMQIGVKGYLTKDRPIDYIICQIRRILDGNIAFCKPTNESLEYPDKSMLPYSLCGRKLSNRELEVIALIKKGLTSNEIAKSLFISVNTVEAHRKHIFKKLGLRNVQSLIEFSNKFPVQSPLK